MHVTCTGIVVEMVVVIRPMMNSRLVVSNIVVYLSCFYLQKYKLVHELDANIF